MGHNNGETAVALKAIYENLDDVPEHFHELYSERDGKFELTGVEGIRTEADVARVQEGARKEREDHKATKDKLAAFDGLDPEEVRSQLDRIPELEAAAGDKIDENKMNELVEARVQTRIAPLERKITSLEKTNGELETTNTGLVEADRRRQIHDSIRTAAGESKILETAMADALMLGERVFEIREDDGAIVTRDNVGVTPGIKAADWLTEIQPTRSHWWPQSQGGGAGGGNGGGSGFANNPWSADNWNVTEQGQVVTQRGMETAQRMAKAAGVEVGATHPKAK